MTTQRILAIGKWLAGEDEPTIITQEIPTDFIEVIAVLDAADDVPVALTANVAMPEWDFESVDEAQEQLPQWQQ